MIFHCYVSSPEGSWGIILPFKKIWDFHNPRTGNPDFNQPEQNGMIEGFISHCSFGDGNLYARPPIKMVMTLGWFTQYWVYHILGHVLL